MRLWWAPGIQAGLSHHTYLQAPLSFLPFTLFSVFSYLTPIPGTLTPFVSFSKDSGRLSCDGRKDADGDSEDEADRQGHDPELGR